MSDRSPGPIRTRNRAPSPSPRRRALAAATAVAALCGVFAAGAHSYAQSQHGDRPRDAVQKSADRLVSREGFPAVLAAVKGENGRTRDYTAGSGDIETGAEVPRNGRVRAGSNTKPFVSAVVLQLVGEGRVRLDEPIETYLPGLVRGKGIDGHDITVRQLLQHTSGLPNYTAYMEQNGFKTRDLYQEPRELLDQALRHEAEFAPGERWKYSNTNYVLAGLLIQKVTGRPVGEEITNRIIRPLGLRDTYWPGVGDEEIRGPHPKGYDAPEPGGELADITRLDPSWGWSAGQLISTPRDLNTFFSSLLGGKVLRPAELKEMKTTVAADDFLPGWRYGLGLFESRLSCGDTLWGHGGDINGYETSGGVTADGRAVTVAVTALPSALAADETEMLAKYQRVLDLVDTAVCG